MIIYGINPVLEAVRTGRASEVMAIAPHGDRVRELLKEARALGVAVRTVDQDTARRLAHGGVHQGVIARSQAAPEATLESLASATDGPPLIVVLDGVEDPNNVGAILRSIHAAGATGLVRQTRRAAPLDGGAAKASAGAVHHVPVCAVVNIARAIEDLKELGVWTVGLDASADLHYDAMDLTLPTAIVVGAEGSGLRRLVRERCDRLASIPMRGQVGSLNVSVAAAVLLFEAVRQRNRGRQGS
ncbi:MAG TPA: 23S rRNA (guanosine(2251)-2'-O)-methyltransferase RlmB [Vicinamibacterales bacterium]|nr:23S rRNA (guanosine(2251)-2'-O)-methyltransferase RlmB [Vicinamibacterales bacterium]